MGIWKRACWYGQYRWKARRQGAPQSLLGNRLISTILTGRSSDKVEPSIRPVRERWKQSQEEVAFEDLGAGSNNRGGGPRRVKLSVLANRSSRSSREGDFLYRLCAFLQPNTCLELGTHLGFSSLYQLSAVPESRFVTIEGAPELARLASECWKNSGLDLYPEQVIGSFDEVLPKLLKDGFRPDYVLIDGNHQYEATLRYVRWLMEVMDGQGTIVLDDIYWSEGMKKAWEDICSWPGIGLTVDLFQFGLLFLSSSEEKEHLTCRWR